MAKSKKIVIVGAGPCGLGAAWRLNELGFSDYELFEKDYHVGGLASSFVDEKGFTWDIGGHVQFSHYDYFDHVMNTVMPHDQWLTHTRESWVWMKNRFIPYPLQNNIGRLPAYEMLECLAGLMGRSRRDLDINNANFQDWILHFFGKGIAKHFLIPYNRKVWAYPPEDLSANWIGERVAVPSFRKVVENIIAGKDDSSWGPNNTFRFPLHGGTGAIWGAVAGCLPEEKIHLNTELQSWDWNKKILKFSNGIEQSYDCLISTMPIDRLLQANDDTFLQDAAPLVYSSSNIVGIGLKGTPPEKVRSKCWMYFPEDPPPTYRVTVFSNYSYNNVPHGDYWSLMGEVSESPKKAVDHDRLIELVVKGLRDAKLIEGDTEIMSTWSYRAEHGYPTPFLGRDKILNTLQAELKKRDVFSRGRFGAWKYEVSNQDHVFMQGVEAVENILLGAPESTLNQPSLVNTHRIR